VSTGPVGYVDTTLRDLAAHPWAGSISTEEIAAVAAQLANSGAVALEALDSFSARGALEGRTESPWDRLRVAVKAAKSVPVGIVVAARTLFGDLPVGADLARSLVRGACESGARRIRVIDPLNDADALLPLAEAAVAGGAELVPTLVLGPSPVYTDRRWLDEARAISQLPGALSICLVDRAGHLRPAELAELVPRVAEVAGLPVELSLVGPGGLAPVSAVEGIEAGAARVQASVGAAALAAARPSVETLRAALAGGPRELQCERALINQLAGVIWSLIPADRLRQAQATEAGPALGLPLDLATGLASRLTRLGLSDRLIDASLEVTRVAQECGNPTLAHPLGPAVVAQAARHIIEGERWREVEPVLVAAIRGGYGRLRGDVADVALAAAEAALMPDPAPGPDLAALTAEAPEGMSEEDVLLWAQFPEASERLLARRRSLVGEATDGLAGATVDRSLIETLVDVVEASGEAEVSVEVGGARVTVRRSSPAHRTPTPGADPDAGAAGDGLVRVESPIVGTYYAAQSPEAPPFVKEGDAIGVGQTLCIIEAMKIFNEIVADQAGTMREICVQNSEAVEYGTLLFLIQP
jgi:oxaloacetate decarboxylase (Na+ extruding) subunit alpha